MKEVKILKFLVGGEKCHRCMNIEINNRLQGRYVPPKYRTDNHQPDPNYTGTTP